MKIFLLPFLFLFPACSCLLAQDYKAYYQDLLQPGEKMLWANYQHAAAKTPDGRFVRMTFHPEKRVMTHRAFFADKKLKIKNGPYQEWYDNGKLWMEGRYENNLQEGEWLLYSFPEGTLSERGPYNLGLREGKWISLDTSGRVVMERHFAAGKLHGDWTFFNKEGTVVKTQTYRDGEMISEQISPLDTLPQLQQMPFLKGCENPDPDVQKACSDQKMLESLYKQIQYPMSARLKDVQGTAIFNFVIEKDGSISSITTMRGICQDIENECIRVIQLMPPWHPGMKNGEPVRVKFNLPIHFKLE